MKWNARLELQNEEFLNDLGLICAKVIECLKTWKTTGESHKIIPQRILDKEGIAEEVELLKLEV